MPEMHLRQPGFIYGAFGPFTKNKERIKKFKETGDSRYIYQKQVDKAWFQHNKVYRDFKDFTRRTASDKILHDKTFDIAKYPKYDGSQRGLDLMVYNFFDKKASAKRARSETLAMQNKFADSGIKNENMSNKESAEELHKPITRKFEKNKSTLTFY